MLLALNVTHSIANTVTELPIGGLAAGVQEHQENKGTEDETTIG